MSNTDASSFLSKENVEMIWDLIADEDIMQNKTEQHMMNFQKTFITDIREFYQREKSPNRDLMTMNKMFIEKVSMQLSSAPAKEQKEKSVITAEDIQASRMNEFEKQFAKKQSEFSNAMTLQVPEKPTFTDEMDKPIGEMEDLIARTLAQRNFDIEQIQQNVDREKVKSFLQSQETSIKSEKGETQKVIQQILKPAYNVSESEVKYIQIGQEELLLPKISEVIDLQKTNNERRQVSWADEENVKLTISDTKEKQSIFSKLKLKPRVGEGSLNPFENVLEMDLKPTADEELKALSKKVDDLSSKIDAIFEFIKNTNANINANANANTNINKIDENTV